MEGAGHTDRRTDLFLMKTDAEGRGGESERENRMVNDASTSNFFVF